MKRSRESPQPLADGPPRRKNRNSFLDLESYYMSSKFSDLTVQTGDKEFKVHKLVMCGKSGWFSRLLYENGNWMGTANDIVRLEGDDTHVVEAMIRFIYNRKYNECEFELSEYIQTSLLLAGVRLYQIADKYDVPSLKQESKDSFRQKATDAWDDDSFPHAITEVYTMTPSENRDLRDIVVKKSVTNGNQLLQREDFLKALEDNPTFAVDFIQASSVYFCRVCEFEWSAHLDELNKFYYCPGCKAARSGHKWAKDTVL